MELTNDFRVGVPVERAWAVLTDVELIAPCLPGAQLQEVHGEGDDAEYRGVVKVKVGPITVQYKGAATFLEKDEPNRVVLKAEGRETRGQGGASATITAVLSPDGDGTAVRVTTDLTVTGKVASFGRGVLADVSANLLGQFVNCLEEKVLSAGGTAAGEASEAGPEAEAGAGAGAGEGDAAAAAGGGNGAAARAEAEGNGQVTGGAPTAREPEVVVATEEPVEPGDGEAAEPLPSAPKVRKIAGPEAEPVDLVATAGSPVLKRAAPAAAVLAVLWLIALFLRRKRK